MRLRSLRWVGQSVTRETGLPGSAQSGVWRVRAHRDSATVRNHVNSCEVQGLQDEDGGAGGGDAEEDEHAETRGVLLRLRVVMGEAKLAMHKIGWRRSVGYGGAEDSRWRRIEAGGAQDRPGGAA